jgi:alkanesulfonate monooxygenase SsuD/methylene tetrahydromethanopterin reductase-like flavin-dependent oxidoreductase (luciferase family)
MTAPLRFHWRLIQGGDLAGTIAPERLTTAVALPEMAAQIAFCREAEQSGIDSVLVDISSGKPDPIVLAMALAASTERLKFMVAHRPGLMSPTLFAQQVNTFSTLASGRITLNMVVGYSPAEQLTYCDAVTHDARYERMHEYLTICARYWGGGDREFCRAPLSDRGRPPEDAICRPGSARAGDLSRRRLEQCTRGGVRARRLLASLCRYAGKCGRGGGGDAPH